MIEKEKQQVLCIFDEAIYKVSHKLLRIELRKMTDANGWKPDETKEYYRGVIHMHGYLNATLIYYFPEELYDYIVRTMNCGSLPSEDERQLYIGEFINITCGHAISRLNDMLGKSTRITVPHLYARSDILEEIPEENRMVLPYQSEKGVLHVIACSD